MKKTKVKNSPTSPQMPHKAARKHRKHHKSTTSTTTSATTDSLPRFRYSSTSGNLLPLQTIRQRFLNIYNTLTWPLCVKILKADIAVTIALAFLLIDCIRNVTSTGGILACLAVEFVHPSKSYGFLAEDVFLGSIMCSVAAAWSILGIYLSSLVRDPNDPTLAQPKVCAILACFLVFGSFCLNLFRVKVEQANVGGMLSATILVISLTSAVLRIEFDAIPTLQLLVPTLVGFTLIFLCFFLIFPENSTRVYTQHLIKVFETFDDITQRQVTAFLRVTPTATSVLESFDSTNSLASIHNNIDGLITALVQKKRMVRREPSFNTLAPTDASDLTSHIKSLRVPLQGLGLSRAMEENMRKAEKTVFADMEKEQAEEEKEGQLMPTSTMIPQSKFKRPRSYYGCTDDEDEEDCSDGDISIATIASQSPPPAEDSPASPPANDTAPNSANSSVTSVASSTATNTIHSISAPTTPTCNTFKDEGMRRRRRKIRWDDSMKVMSYWRQDYDDVLNIVKPTYLELTNACSTAVKESVKRLRRMQNLDPRFQDKPFFYKYYYKWKVGAEQEAQEKQEFEYDLSCDPSVQLYEAIQRFHEHRLIGLERLYSKTGVPRRILFLLLTFQFNLHAYAESIYTLTSLIYELDQIRLKRKFWWPHISFGKWLLQSHKTDESYELDSPYAIKTTQEPVTLQRTLSKSASMIRAAAAAAEASQESTEGQQQQGDVDLEKQQSPHQQQRVLYRLDTPHRGQAHSPKEHVHQHSVKEAPIEYISRWRRNELDPLDYHDPDVAYPTTATQRFFYRSYIFLRKNLYTADAAFALRAAVIVACLSLPAWLESSCRWYNAARGQWACVIALIWMGPSVGSSFFGTVTRLVGTFIGAVEGIVIWEISRGSVPGLIILTFVCYLPWWMIYINGKFWKATGLFTMITISLIVGYSYTYKPDGVTVVSVFTVTWERTVSALIGVLSALFVSIFPYASTGRVILRHRISETLSEIGALYSSFLALLLKNTPDDETTRTVHRKLFRSVAASIRRQIKGERVLLEQSRFEPALRGIFPEAKYLHILQILDTILCLMLEMEFALEKIPHTWRMMIVKDTWKERKEMISSFLVAFHLGSNALTSKAPLPPYVLRPTKARRNLTNKARKLDALKFSHLGEREYTYFSCYLMNSEQLAVEIELLIATIRDLVGPDSVSVWLNYKH